MSSIEIQSELALHLDESLTSVFVFNLATDWSQNSATTPLLSVIFLQFLSLFLSSVCVWSRFIVPGCKCEFFPESETFWTCGEASLRQFASLQAIPSLIPVFPLTSASKIHLTFEHRVNLVLVLDSCLARKYVVMYKVNCVDGAGRLLYLCAEGWLVLNVYFSFDSCFVSLHQLIYHVGWYIMSSFTTSALTHRGAGIVWEVLGWMRRRWHTLYAFVCVCVCVCMKMSQIQENKWKQSCWVTLVAYGILGFYLSLAGNRYCLCFYGNFWVIIVIFSVSKTMSKYWASPTKY